jgi:hypothetical protein
MLPKCDDLQQFVCGDRLHCIFGNAEEAAAQIQAQLAQ